MQILQNITTFIICNKHLLSLLRFNTIRVIRIENNILKSIRKEKSLLEILALKKNKRKTIKFILKNCFRLKRYTNLYPSIKKIEIYYTGLSKNNNYQPISNTMALDNKTLANSYFYRFKINSHLFKENGIIHDSLNSLYGKNNSIIVRYPAIYSKYNYVSLENLKSFKNNLVSKKISSILLMKSLSNIPLVFEEANLSNSGRALYSDYTTGKSQAFAPSFKGRTAIPLKIPITQKRHLKLQVRNVKCHKLNYIKENNKDIFNPLLVLKKSSHFAYKLIQKIINLNNASKQISMATIIPKTQAMQNHELRKIDSKLSSIKEAIEALVKFNKQNEIDKLGLNLFQKRKAFSDFL